jgi:hypothetical protein
LQASWTASERSGDESQRWKFRKVEVAVDDDES